MTTVEEPVHQFPMTRTCPFSPPPAHETTSDEVLSLESP